MKNIPFKSFFLATLIAATSIYGTTIQTSNRILTRVGSKTITVLDVKREMDRQIYMNNPKMFGDITSTCGYYYQNWKATLNKITQDEIFMLEADHMNYEIPSYEITQKVTQMFGENEIEAYRFLSMTPEQARAIGEREMYSSHLSWFQIWSKSLMEATPKAILGAYATHVEELAKKDTWTYQALYVKGDDEKLVEETTATITTLLQDGKCENLSLILDHMKDGSDDVKVGVSKDITLQTNELSPSLLAVLENLEEGMTSEVIAGSRNGTFTGKILQLKEHKKEEIPALAKVSEGLKNSIVNSVGEQITRERFTVLYKQYDVEGLFGDELFASELQPFALLDE